MYKIFYILQNTESGVYIYTESSSPRRVQDVAELMTPLLKSKQYCIRFAYHMHGSATGDLKLLSVEETNDNTAASPIRLWEKSGPQGNQWRSASASFFPAHNSKAVQFIIQGRIGTSFTSDMALDDIRITVGQCAEASTIASTTTASPTTAKIPRATPPPTTTLPPATTAVPTTKTNTTIATIAPFTTVAATTEPITTAIKTTAPPPTTTTMTTTTQPSTTTAAVTTPQPKSSPTTTSSFTTTSYQTTTPAQRAISISRYPSGSSYKLSLN